jgi:hypothetical protein
MVPLAARVRRCPRAGVGIVLVIDAVVSFSYSIDRADDEAREKQSV